MTSAYCKSIGIMLYCKR